MGAGRELAIGGKADEVLAALHDAGWFAVELGARDGEIGGVEPDHARRSHHLGGDVDAASGGRLVGDDREIERVLRRPDVAWKAERGWRRIGLLHRDCIERPGGGRRGGAEHHLHEAWPAARSRRRAPRARQHAWRDDTRAGRRLPEEAPRNERGMRRGTATPGNAPDQAMYPELARAFGGKHHATVISAVQKIIERVNDGPPMLGRCIAGDCDVPGSMRRHELRFVPQ
jgi:hypothetical protein